VERAAEREASSAAPDTSPPRGLRRWLPMGARADATELLDSGSLSQEETDRNLVDLARLNRLPGGTSASVAAILRLLDGARDATILDAGTGRADMPASFAAKGWRSVALDVNRVVLAIARGASAGEPLVEVMEGDVRSLPFADGAFDVAHASLLIHHLDPDEAVVALRELARVGRRGVVVNDLRRGLLPLVASWATIAAVGRSPVTRRDGTVSVRRAYTLAELDALLARAGLVVRWRSSAWLPRVVTAASRA
jgi:SAM-dependent methyltransferase